MNATYDENLLRQYLLGSLSIADTETCDELSFTDDGFVMRLQAVEDDLVDAYVLGQLSGGESAQFESHYLVSPRRREKVEFARSLQNFTAKQSITAPLMEVASAEPEQRTTRESAGWWQSLRALFSLPKMTIQYGLVAASSLLLLMCGWLMIPRLKEQQNAAPNERAALQAGESSSPTQPASQQILLAQNIEQPSTDLNRTKPQQKQLNQPPKSVARSAVKPVPAAPQSFQRIELLPQTRGISRTVEVTMEAKRDYAILQLATPEEEVTVYQAELLTADGQLRWKSGKLKARTGNSVRILDVRVAAKLLPPGSYIVQLKGRTDTGQVEDLRKYFFKVVK